MYEVVVGIDFGSSRIGFAYSFYDKSNIIHGNIYGVDMDSKVPSEIILDEDYNIIEFGSNCIKYLKEKGLEVGHYFKEIKKQLYDKKEFIKAKNSEKEFPLKLIIQKVLEKIKELAIEEIGKNRPHLKEKKIKWVVTVPSIWTEYEKNVMMEASIGAGLINENTDKSLFFVLEPVAALLYCSINSDFSLNYFNKGEYYIVCDLGRGNGNIVAHLFGSNINNTNEIHLACGGKFGSNEIDRLIYEEIILKIFGCKDFNSFYSKYKRFNKDESDEFGELFNDWSSFEREIKDFTEGVTIEKIYNNEKHCINFSLFKDIFDDDVKLNDLIKEYNYNIYESELYLKEKKAKINGI